MNMNMNILQRLAVRCKTSIQGPLNNTNQQKTAAMGPDIGED